MPPSQPSKAKNIDINIKRISDFVEDHLDRVGLSAGNIPPLSSLEFSIHGSCNRRCSFCPRVDKEAYPNIQEDFPLDVFKRTMDELGAAKYSGRISFSGFSEPLLNKSIFEMISYAKAQCPGITVEVVSNGDYLKEAILRNLFESGLDNLRVSLYTPDDTVDRFIKMKDAVGLTDEQFIIRKRNQTKENDFGLTISNRAGTIKFENTNLKPLEEPMKQGCNYPMYKVMVDYTGDVLICSNDWAKKKVVGNLKKESILDVWKSPAMDRVRVKLLNGDRRFAPCASCDVHGLMNGQGHNSAWTEYYRTKGMI